MVNSKGLISARTKAGYEDYQLILLEEEGVEFNASGSIYLQPFRWDA
jgi:alkylated DNA nucleotide flippase Atl1